MEEALAPLEFSSNGVLLQQYPAADCKISLPAGVTGDLPSIVAWGRKRASVCMFVRLALWCACCSFVQLNTIGLANLGNTCFMNCVIQCLSSTSRLSEFFLSEEYAKEINMGSPFGTHGQLAHNFANLIKQLWASKESQPAQEGKAGTNWINPSEFRQMLVQYAPQFKGQAQQDAHEFMAYMLDALHEDFNRPSVQNESLHASVDSSAGNGSTKATPEVALKALCAWQQHRQRNNSSIVDMFHGQLVNSIVCPHCCYKSDNFEPFVFLSLPVPAKYQSSFQVTVLPTISQGIINTAVTYGIKVHLFCSRQCLQHNLVFYLY